MNDTIAAIAALMRTNMKKRFLPLLFSSPPMSSSFQWAWMDSNHRPHPYQGCALTELSYRPEAVEEDGTRPFRQSVLALRKTVNRRRFVGSPRATRHGWRDQRRSASVTSTPPTMFDTRL